MASFVLVHGAWHGGWCWHKVVAELQRLGHRAIAPDLPGHGEDATPAEKVDLLAYADRVCACIEAESEPVVLVGHSMGGLVISESAERLPDRIHSLVYLAAVLPRDGDGFADIPGAPAVAEAIEATADGVALRFRPERAQEVFYADCSEADVAFAVERLCPQPLGVRGFEVRLSAQRFGSVARDYIECSQDRAIEVGDQRGQHQRSPCRSVYKLDSSHSPFFSMPEALARLLVESSQ
jgi:pimeloyl-ACP methyl ester carboxylesterase